ncbi:DUF3581 domain-containing protein [Thioalkalivibrio paradoxus]|uniref:DUF3581 domain-containing protein n=1 Tax=Thioalkalivibrio paradoxus ARh 1 TaxID=713585 RepID=W0DFV3_9GAMM|nr:DUF3581 domain-containing protein [Thioalkalivibrio paradoxus]AHE97529.1 hypothetical protein THITH_03780 [Thioalkalivibrio paradoxus ARh 1]
MTDGSFLQSFHTLRDGLVYIEPEQASRFAKEIAGDFNPIHDPGSRRFCVPGDLLFALVLARYGVSAGMHLRFVGMVGAGVALVFPDDPGTAFAVMDSQGKKYLEVEREGPVVTDGYTVEALTRSYVAFSGENFPHVLVPLMERHAVMVNPARPLVMYDRMSLSLREPVGSLTETVQPRLKAADMRVDGKRGEARLDYALCVDGEPFATGSKHLVLSGLRPYDAETVRKLVDEYAGWKARYAGAIA